MTAQPDPIVPGDLFARQQTITGLRQLADFLEGNPAVPVEEYGRQYHVFIDERHGDAAARAEIGRIANLLNATPVDNTANGGHLTVFKTFGRITYKAVYIPARAMALHSARASYAATSASTRPTTRSKTAAGARREDHQHRPGRLQGPGGTPAAGSAGTAVGVLPLRRHGPGLLRRHLPALPRHRPLLRRRTPCSCAAAPSSPSGSSWAYPPYAIPNEPPRRSRLSSGYWPHWPTGWPGSPPPSKRTAPRARRAQPPSPARHARGHLSPIRLNGSGDLPIVPETSSHVSPPASLGSAASSVVTAWAARDLADKLSRPDFHRLAARTKALGGCAQPVHLRGRVHHIDPVTGRILHRYSTVREPGGVLRVACKTRRASRCPACAETYRADTYQLVRAGLVGGKGVPESVSTYPAAFVTLTAPSFGPVHTRREKAGGRVDPCHARRDAGTCPHGRPLSCTIRHATDDPRLGTPLCPECYDFAGSVLFNAHAPELWRRFTLALRRRVAKAAGLTLVELRDSAVVSFAKVAEYQRRGVVHFHAVVRLDGPGGPSTVPPGWATYELLADAVRQAVHAVTVTTPEAPGLPSRSLAWGAQLDIRPITTTGELTDKAVAGYVAKYATKAAECVGALDRRVRATDDPADLPVSPHARRLIAECLRLGALPEFAGLRLVEWAHMLGFRGHFSTKSRRYSVTLGRLRNDRVRHNERRHDISTGRLPFDDDPVLVVAQWQYLGQGLTPGEALLTAALTGKPLPPLNTIAVTQGSRE